MGYHAVTLHFTESETTISGSTFCGLPGQNLNWSSASRVHLVVDHVLQSLVEGGCQEDHDLHFLSREAIVHNFIASELVAQGMELIGDRLDRILFLSILEWGGVSFNAIKCSYFGR